MFQNLISSQVTKCVDDEIESDIEGGLSEEEAALDIEDDNEDIPDTGISWVTGSSGMKFFPFTKSERLLTQPDGSSPLDNFRLLLTLEFLKGIVDVTNIYAT